MRTFLLLFLTVVCAVLCGCKGDAYTITQFPWTEAAAGGDQEQQNEITRSETEYYGNIFILNSKPKFDAKGAPKKLKTEMRIYGFLRADSSKRILDETFFVNAHDLRIVERSGDASGSTIVISDTDDSEQWRVDLVFDKTTKSLAIKRVSSNLKRND